MTEELKKAIQKAQALPAEKQRLMAEFILDEIEWESSFQSSAEKLSLLAKEALTDYKSGKTKTGDW